MEGNPMTDAERETLRILWAEGHSTNEIGRRMKRSKNSIVGYAHRMFLPSRPNPVKGGGPKHDVRRPERVPKKTLPPLASVPHGNVHASRIGTGMRFKEALAPVVPPMPVAFSRIKQCQWPSGGEKRGEPYRFECREPPIVAPGPNGEPIHRPYCAVHSRRAYVIRPI